MVVMVTGCEKKNVSEPNIVVLISKDALMYSDLLFADSYFWNFAVTPQ